MSDPAKSHPELRALVGTTLSERYRVERLLALDELGARFVSRQLPGELSVGLRVLGPQVDTSALERDSRTFTQLDHRGCLRTLGVGKTAGGLLYIVTEAITGPSLSQASQAWSLDAILDAGQQLFELLAYAHTHGVVHGALGAQTVFANAAEQPGEGVRVVVADLGLAKLSGSQLRAGTQVYGSTASTKSADILAAAQLLRTMIGEGAPLAATRPIDNVLTAARGSSPPEAAAVVDTLRELRTQMTSSAPVSESNQPGVTVAADAASRENTAKLALPTLEAGRVIAERFRLEAPLGQGGMGVVWRATHLALQSPVAIKLLFPSQLDPEEARARFLREARASAALRSSNIVQVFDYGVYEDMPYLVMEMLEGESLEARLDRGALGFAGTLAVIKDVCSAIARAHEHGVIHRDLKPANIFLVTDEHGKEKAKVLDFGIAKFMDGPGDAQLGETKTGAILGTPYYMSPEQLQESKSVDHRADLWALGVITFQCLTGQRPFDSRSLVDLCISITTKDAPVPGELATLPPGVNAWMRKALERDPEGRFDSADALFTALAAVEHGPPPAASRALPRRRKTNAEIDFGDDVGPALSLERPLEAPRAISSSAGGGYRQPQVEGKRSPWPFVLIVLGLAVLVGGYLLLGPKRGPETDASAETGDASPALTEGEPGQAESGEAETAPKLPPSGFGDTCSAPADCGWDDPCAPTRCVGAEHQSAGACDTPASPPGECSCIEQHCVLRPSASAAPPAPVSCASGSCGLDQASGRCVAGAMEEANEHHELGLACVCEPSTRVCETRWLEPLSCKSAADCWVTETAPFFPVPRPKAKRGEKFLPCRDGEYAPTCRGGQCSLIIYNCD